MASIMKTNSSSHKTTSTLEQSTSRKKKLKSKHFLLKNILTKHCMHNAVELISYTRTLQLLANTPSAKSENKEMERFPQLVCSSSSRWTWNTKLQKGKSVNKIYWKSKLNMQKQYESAES